MPPSTKPDAPPASPKRPHTILGRLATAVREQNWFAVVLEVCIVIVGVVIGFQVTSWGQDRADRAREQTYLRQLVEDLTETETLFEDIQPRWARRDSSAAMLVRPFRSARKPPPDSMLAWMNHLNWMQTPPVVTGTATALVETGDLNLIRDDSLRSAITRYVDLTERWAGYWSSNSERIRDHLTTLSERVDMFEASLVQFRPGRSDSLARADPVWPIPVAPERAFAPLDVEAFYQDREAYTALQNIWQRRFALRLGREVTLRATVALREQIEAELNP
jgi:hypothetical protein